MDKSRAHHENVVGELKRSLGQTKLIKFETRCLVDLNRQQAEVVYFTSREDVFNLDTLWNKINTGKHFAKLY